MLKTENSYYSLGYQDRPLKMVPSCRQVAEQHILQKCSKCSRFGVMSTLLKVATIAITHLTMDLGLKNTKQTIFRLYKSATTHLWQPYK